MRKYLLFFVLILCLIIGLVFTPTWKADGVAEQLSYTPSSQSAAHVLANNWFFPAALLHGRVLKLEKSRYIIVDLTGDIYDAGHFWLSPQGDYMVLRGFSLKMNVHLSKTSEGDLAFDGWLTDRFSGGSEVTGLLRQKKPVAWPSPETIYDAAMLGDAVMLLHWFDNERPNIPGAAKYNSKKPPYTSPILVAASYCHSDLVNMLVREEGDSRTFDGQSYLDLWRDSHCDEF